MVDLKALGVRIRDLRQKQGLTQTELAEVLHVSFQAVSNWERGIAPPDIENLLRITAHFGVLLDTLFSPAGESLYLGIDGGGTKTEFVAVSADGRVHGRVVKNGSNPNDIGYGAARDVILSGIREILAVCPTVKGVFGGIAGMTVGEYAKRLTADVRQLFPQSDVEIAGDARNLFALRDGTGSVLISGTGSVVFFKRGEEYRRLGGWGYLLDRAGSAYDIGRDAVRQALGEEDAKKPPSLLSRLLYEKMGPPTAWEHIGALYDGGKPYIASFASVVFDAYREGDEIAAHILDENARALAELWNTGASLYGEGGLAVASGGLFEHHADILAPLVERHSRVKLTVCTLPPVYGACRTACRNASCQMKEDFFTTFQKTYGEQKI